MAQTFYFYDLETSGINPKESRVMQFAGQRTDSNFKPIGEPMNVMIALNDDVLPDPEAVLVTGITPQQSKQDGYTEAEFLKLFFNGVVQPDTIFVGYNNIRFDDEFMRYLLYRNFYDPYEWQWANNCSRWDLLDVVRMTRALRPEGVVWPTDNEGKATNRLELITKANAIRHDNAHDALGDVVATIAIARLLHNKQPKLFDYLLQLRDKRNVQALVEGGQPFVYTSGRLPAEFQKTSVFTYLCDMPDQPGTKVVYNLRYDSTELATASNESLQELLTNSKEHGRRIKTIKYNRSPAVAPIGVLTDANYQTIGLDLSKVTANVSLFHKHQKTLTKQVQAVLKENAYKASDNQDIPAESRLYEGFINDNDKTKMRVVRAATPQELKDIDNEFIDVRLRELFPRYKARNFSKILSDDERAAWEEYRVKHLLGNDQDSRLVMYGKKLAELSQTKTDERSRFLLQELQLYAESIIPVQY